MCTMEIDHENRYSTYEALKMMEQERPDPQESIRLRLPIDSLEYHTLITNGISPERIARDELRRSELIEAGYVFMNRIGGGEKPIMNSIVSAIGGDVLSEDFGVRFLLTAEELSRAVSERTVDNGEDFDAIRRDMVNFFSEAEHASTGLQTRRIETFRLAQRLILETFSHDDQKIVATFFQKIQNQKDGRVILDGVFQESIAGIDVVFVRGIPIEMVLGRGSKIRDLPSPFLDSGFHFGSNPDVTLYPNDPSRTRRINMVTVHLLSRGLSETGGSRNGSHDQEYIGAQEYRDTVLAKTSTPNGSVTPEALNTIAQRIVFRARRYIEVPDK